jgi:Signal transduction histidine kinase
MARSRFLPRLLALAFAPLALAAAPVASAQNSAEPLRNAAAVLSLRAEQAAQQLPILVKGVVTAAEADWTGQFFVQDETGGVFVENLRAPGPTPGDIVEVAGVSHPGAFAPIISSPQWRKVDTAPLPKPKPVQIADLEAGVEDGWRVEIEGIVRSVRTDPDRTHIDLAVAGFRLQVSAPRLGMIRPEALIAGRVRVRGTAATHYNAALRHLTSVAVYAPSWDDLTLLEPEAGDPFAQPAIPLKQVAEYRRGSGPSQRVHVRGIVTHQRVGEAVFLQDATAGLRIESSQPDTFSIGEEVEAAGFLEFQDFLPLLRDAEFRRIRPARAAIAPQAPTWTSLKRGLHHASLITLRGKILDHDTRPISRPLGGFSGVLTTWWLQGSEMSFAVEYEAAAEDGILAAIPIGSIVELDGVCMSSVDVQGRLQSLTLLLPRPESMRVIARPSWWTPRRLLIAFALVSAVLLVVIAWLLTISRKNAALRVLIREREQAQRELQEAHDTLEQKVAERSAQLQIEMTARRTAELQFKAVLAERTRLARDLHDSLEQTLTGIALQLDTSAKLFARLPEQAQHHLQLARNWLHQSQVSLRRSIWDLRSRELEQFDLARALQQSAEQMTAGTELALEFATLGERRALPEIVEENILRIGQEALTNVAKHAHATKVSVALEFTPHALKLRVSDNGRGFDIHESAPGGVGHFGLMGMRERAKRLGGRLDVESATGRGTAVSVEIPLDPIEDLLPAAAIETPPSP